MTPHQLLCSAIFIAIYVLVIVFHDYKSIVAWIGVVLLVIMGALSPLDVARYINWNILGIFWGSLVIAELFIHSRIPAFIAESIIDRSKSLVWAIIWLSAFSGIISAFVENVATVLIVAPIAFEVSKKLKVSAVPFILGICLSSNLQGTATLVGDPPSMILAGATRMTFNDFFFFHGKPSLFFAVECAAVFSLVVIYFINRKHREPIAAIPTERVVSYMPGLFLILLIAGLAIGSFMPGFMDYLGGGICMAIGLCGIVWSLFSRKIKTYHILRDTDWETFFFLAAIFAIVGSLTETGTTQVLAEYAGQLTSGNVLLTYIVLVVFSIVVSAFVDNVPYFAAMVGVVSTLSAQHGYPIYLLLFGTVLGTTIGGNITPIGAAANIVGVGQLKKNGYRVNFIDFIKVGLPFTFGAIIPAALFIWLFWR